MEAISAIGIFSSVVYIVLLFNKKVKTFSDKILLVWMFLFAIHLILPLMMAFGNLFFIEKVDGLDIGLYTLHITFLYYYSLSVTKKIKSFQLNHLLFLIPTSLIYIVQNTLDAYVNLFKDLISALFFDNEWMFHLASVAALNMVFCLYFSDKLLRLLAEHRQQIRNNYSFSENIDLNWLRNITLFAVLMTAMTIVFLIALIKGYMSGNQLNSFYFSLISIFAVVQGYLSLKQKSFQIFVSAAKQSSNTVSKNNKPETQTENQKSFDDSQMKLIFDYMENEKPYLDSDLNIGTLANTLNLHTYQLSKYINSCCNKNFFEFINEYRVDEFKKLVANPKNKNYSILGLAYDAGFSSKATFNRIFKNQTGQTPSEFRESFAF